MPYEYLADVSVKNMFNKWNATIFAFCDTLGTQSHINALFDYSLGNKIEFLLLICLVNNNLSGFIVVYFIDFYSFAMNHITGF